MATAGLDERVGVRGDERRGRPVWVAWVRDARRGDREAFAELHDHFGGLVHAVVIARVPAADAADLAQQVFLVMLEKLSALEDDQAFPAWLMQVARSQASRWARDNKRRMESPEALPDGVPANSAGPDARKVLAALRSMPEAYAETLAMRLIEGMTGPEIAERTGLTPGSVRVNLHRGMELLRERLGVTKEGGRHE